MGRPRVYDSRTGTVLLDAAEKIVARCGPDALSVRAVATECGVSTRAVYSVYGSKEAMIAALGNRAFAALAAAIRALPMTSDPMGDVVATGVDGFRRVMAARPALFAIGIQSSGVDDTARAAYLPAADEAFELLLARVARLKAAGRLPHHEVHEAAVQFHALCEGLAALELRKLTRCAPEDEEWRARWTQALRALLVGFRVAEVDSAGRGPVVRA